MSDIRMCDFVAGSVVHFVRAKIINRVQYIQIWKFPALYTYTITPGGTVICSNFHNNLCSPEYNGKIASRHIYEQD